MYWLISLTDNNLSFMDLNISRVFIYMDREKVLFEFESKVFGVNISLSE